MNFLKATATGQGRIGLAEGQTLPLKTLIEPGRALRIGIRPEHMDGGSTVLTLPVEAIEHLGTTNYVYARGPAGGEVVVEKRILAAPGDRISAAVDPATIRVFDTDRSRVR